MKPSLNKTFIVCFPLKTKEKHVPIIIYVQYRFKIIPRCECLYYRLKKIFIGDVLKIYSNQQSIYRNLKIITLKPFNYRENRVNRM